MRGITITGIVAVCAALTAATGGPSGGAAAESWRLELATQYFPAAGSHSQYDLVLAEGRTGWFFGGSNVTGRGVPEIEVRSDGRWIQSVLPSGLRSSIAGASAVSATDIWAVTYLGGAVLNWNGSSWLARPQGRWNDDARFTGIVALGAGDVWLFGEKGRSRPGAGTWHLSGSKWTKASGAAAEIYQASAASRTDLWGIGGTGGSMRALLRYSGSTWRQVSPGALKGFSYSYVLAFAPANVWVAGSVAGAPELAHYDGRGWTTWSMPGTTPATGMCRDGRGGLWVIANSGAGPSTVLDRSANGSWTSAPVGPTPATEVLGCAALSSTGSALGAGVSAAPAGTAAAAYSYAP
jgi:hypothetical protein